jgi:hypothetical protein
VSVSAVLYPRWPPLLKIEISSNGQNGSILSQNRLKSSSLCLYSSNLGTFWLKIEPFWPFEEISISSNAQPNFAGMILGWSPFKFVSVSAVLYPRWPPLLKFGHLKKFPFLVMAAILDTRRR